MLFSIVIPVKNDVKNLKICLETLRAFDDVVIVDSGSEDETADVASQYGREVVNFTWDGHFPKKRNWILRHHSFRHEWVLFLDADERITDAFVKEVNAKIAEGKWNGFWVSYDNWFLGRMLHYGDTMRKLPLVKIGCGEYERIEEDSWSKLDMEIHEQLIVSGDVGTISARLEHHDMRRLDSYQKKHEAYAQWESNRYCALMAKKDFSQLTSRQRMKYQCLTKWWFPSAYFFASYFLKRGFLDGHAGFRFALGKMRYFRLIQKKIKHLQGKGNKR